ncbi:hypothetical protein, partial [Pseudomonas aeruginosa]|uniref:hypothetical protein n=1 Tax=Pseudomonas aeruginosa TaxID=287 RepID=UPI002358FC12
LAGLLALTGVLGIGEGHLFHHRKARRLVSGDFAKSGSLFQDFLNGATNNRGECDANQHLWFGLCRCSMCWLPVGTRS